MAANHGVETLLVDSAAGHQQAVTTGEFRHEADIFRHVTFRRSGRILVAVDGPGADACDAAWEFGISSRKHKRMQAVREEITEQARTIWIIFAPAEVLIGA